MVPSTSNPQDMKQFLTLVLKQSGPKSVPYVESTKLSIRQHLLDLLTYYPSLNPKTSTFTHNDGRHVNLLQADGTIPMDYHGATYNIPVIIWLTDSYPFHPPCVYLNPTPDMIIKPRHAHVTPSGLVSLPYLHSWEYPSSNLVGLVSELSASFACDPPLYSRPRPPPYQQQRSDDVAEVYKKEAISKMVRRREEEINRRLKEMVEEKEKVEQQLQIISMNTHVIDSGFREKQVKSKTLVDVNVDKCVDALSKQNIVSLSSREQFVRLLQSRVLARLHS